MIDSGVTWIVAADGARARVFEERVRGGALHELAAQALHIEEADRPRARAHSATVHERTGPGRHAASDADPAQEAEARFLRRVVDALEAAAQANAFDRLVLIAPPTALGVLRASLPPGLRSRLETSNAHNRTHANASEMRGHLRQVRALT